MTKRNRKSEAKSSINLDGETINIEPIEEIVIDITEPGTVHQPDVIKGPPMATPEFILISPEHLTYRRKTKETLEEYANRMSDFGVLRVCCNCKRSRPYKQQSCPRCGINLHLFIKERAPGESGDIFHEGMLTYNEVTISNTK